MKQVRALAKIRTFTNNLAEDRRGPPSREALCAESLGVTVEQMQRKAEVAFEKAKPIATAIGRVDGPTNNEFKSMEKAVPFDARFLMQSQLMEVRRASSPPASRNHPALTQKPLPPPPIRWSRMPPNSTVRT